MFVRSAGERRGERAPGALGLAQRQAEAAVAGGDLDRLAADLAQVEDGDAFAGEALELLRLAADQEAAGAFAAALGAA